MDTGINLSGIDQPVTRYFSGCRRIRLIKTNSIKDSGAVELHTSSEARSKWPNELKK
jgi:hypothetical protein